MFSPTPTIGTRLTKGQREYINLNIIPDPGINIIPNGPLLYIISQLKGKDLCSVAQVSRKFNRLTDKYRECIYAKEDFDTLLDKFIFGIARSVFTCNVFSTRSEIWWLARYHPERECSSKVLVWASKYGYIEIVKLLLAANKPCSTDAIGWASTYGYTEIVRLLLEAGSPYSDCTTDALNWASYDGYTEIVRLLLAVNKPCTELALDRASECGHIEIVKLLLEAGSPYSDCTTHALDWASIEGRIEVVRLLLAANKPCTDSALDWASKNGHIEVVKLLLAAQLRVDMLFGILPLKLNNIALEFV